MTAFLLSHLLGSLPNGGLQFAQHSPVSMAASIAQAQAAAAAAAQYSMAGLPTVHTNPGSFGAPITYLPPPGIYPLLYYCSLGICDMN